MKLQFDCTALVVSFYGIGKTIESSCVSASNQNTFSKNEIFLFHLKNGTFNHPSGTNFQRTALSEPKKQIDSNQRGVSLRLMGRFTETAIPFQPHIGTGFLRFLNCNKHFMLIYSGV